MDIKLGVFQDKHPAKYLDLIGEKVQAKSIQDRETWDKDKRKKYKKLCKSEGCGRHAWTGSRSGHCYKHADPSTKMCSKCKLKTRQFAGGLCASCKPPSSGKREKVWCPDCGVREPARWGSRCEVCISRGSIGGRKKAAGYGKGKHNM